MRPAPSLLRFSCSAGLSVLVFSLSAGQARADGGAASPEDMTLDLGGATLETRRVPHGSFTQGASATEPGHDKDEEPAHRVTITKDFWIGKFPVTRGQFSKFVADTRYVSEAEKGQSGGAGWDGKNVPDGGKSPVLVQRKEFTWRHPGFTQTDEHPVVLVSYGDANAFVGWASRKSGKRVRLPTEAEWEFAARAGTTTAWSGGTAAESDPGSFGWFKPNAGNGTRPVGQKKPNALGIFDMSGNVMEWCRDVYAPYREGALVDPESTTNTSSEPERRVLRGGSWYRDAKRGRSAARYKNTPGSRNADNGFRVVVTNEEVVTPGLTGPGPDFVPSSPLGVTGSASSSASGGSSGPLADGEPLRLEPVGHSGDAFSWGLLLASPVAAASAVVAWMLLRRKRTPGAGTRPQVATARSSGVSTRAGDDGFFVSAPNVTPGARVRYECIVNGTQVSDVVPLDGGTETFVYTGSPPTAIRILEILAGARGGYRAADRPAGSAPIDTSQRRAPEPRVPPPVPSPVRNVTTHTHTHTHSHSTHRDSPRPLIVPYVESVIVESASPSPAVVDSAIDGTVSTSEGATAAAAAAAESEAMAAAETLSTAPLTSEDAIAAAAAADAADVVAPSEDATVAKSEDATVAKGEDATVAKSEDATVAKSEDATVAKSEDATAAKSEDATAAKSDTSTATDTSTSDEAFLGNPRAY